MNSTEMQSRIHIDKNEVMRYLGIRGDLEADQIDILIDGCIAEVEDAATPRHALVRIPVSIDAADVTLGPIRTTSRTLARHLKGCSEAVVFAATAGIGIDRLIKRASVSQLARTAVLQAAGAAAVEAYCDQIEQNVRREEAGRGFAAKTRYSPGYGDFSLEVQPQILQLLNASKQAGITLTDGLLMIPSKSVTAVIGLEKVS